MEEKMSKKFLVAVGLAAWCSSAHPISQMVEQCAEMSFAAYDLVDARDRQTEQEASHRIQQYALTQRQFDVLEGLIRIIYSRTTGVDALSRRAPQGPPPPFAHKMPSPGEVAVAMYAACPSWR